MILRKAKLEDYEILKKLYEDTEGLYHFLLKSSKQGKTDYSIIFDTGITLNFEEFKKSEFLFTIEDNSHILGYINLLYLNGNTYKVHEWAMFNPEKHEELLTVLNGLKTLKLPRFKKLGIFTTNETVIELLLSNGFTSFNPSSGFFNLII